MTMVRDREVRICEATGNRVVMEYAGHDYTSNNGHPGWLCLHRNLDDEDESARADEEDVKQFLLDQEQR